MFFSPFLFSFPCSLQASQERPFQSHEAKAPQIATRSEGNREWRTRDKRGREGREHGSVAVVRLNDVFQEEQSSLSNRRLRNELAYLLGLERRCHATAFHIPR